MSDTLARFALTSLITHALTRNFPQVAVVLVQTMEGWDVPNDNVVQAVEADVRLFERFWCKLFDKTATSKEMPRWACLTTAVVHGASLGRAFEKLAAEKCDDIAAAAQYVLANPENRIDTGAEPEKPKHPFTVHQGGLS